MNVRAQVLEAEPATEVAVIVNRETALAVLTDGEKFDAFYAKVKAETDAFVPDPWSDKGRKAIAAMAFKVTKTKTAIDAAGKLLTEEWRSQTSKVDASRRAIRDKLDGLRDEVRKPLTDWEAAEDARVKEVESRLRGIEHAATVWADDGAAAVAGRIAELETMDLDPKVFTENLPLAVSARDHALVTLRSMHARLVHEEADRLELERLRAESAAREEADRLAREQQARAEAAATAARIEAEAAERRKADEEARAKRELEAREKAAAEAAAQAQAAAEQKAQEALRAAEAAHQAEVARLQRAADEAAAARRQEDERAAKAQAERDAEAKRTADAEAARTADRAHRSSIMAAAKGAIMAAGGVGEDAAKKIVLAIGAGEIPNVSLRF